MRGARSAVFELVYPAGEAKAETSATRVTDEQINALEVPEINRILLAELKKIRELMTAEQALKLVLESIDGKIKAIESNHYEPMEVSIGVPMFW